MRSLLLPALLGLAWGCGSAADEHALAAGDLSAPTESDDRGLRSLPEARTVLRIVPEDLMTAVRETPVGVIVLSRYPSEETLATIGAALELITWPEGERVPAEAVHHPAEPSLGHDFHRFEFMTSEPLSDRWHAVRVDLNGADGIEVGAEPVAEGVWVSRFRPDSQPILRTVSIGPGESSFELLIRFSERVRDSRRSTDVVAVMVGGERLACTGSDADALRSADGTDVISVVCPNRSFDSQFTIQLARGLRAIDGRRETEVPFGASATEFRFNPARDRSTSASDRVFTPRAI